MANSRWSRVPPTVEYGVYIMLLLGCIFLLYRHFYGNRNVEPVIIFKTEQTPELPEIELPGAN